ncbi:MAG: HAMP domain-containing sensor histidine kinase [Coriobacteriia bacterium]|nr:HAMP domain-containing sensor histidine kinase [Coriobacteriia bacterium]
MSATRNPASRAPLVYQIFISILVVALSSVLVAGLLIRRSLNLTFTAYVAALPEPVNAMGRGMGRRILGAAEQSYIAQVDRSIWIAALVAIVIAAVGALLLARRVSHPLSQLTGSAKRFAEGALDERVETDGPREIGELADAFNDMAGSLGEAEALRRRLVADVAHELRNPIAAIRAQLEAVSEGVLAMDEARADSLVADVNQLSRLVEDLQMLSVAEAGHLPYVMERLDLLGIVHREAEAISSVLRDGVRTEVVGSPSQAYVLADELRLASVVRNLLSNAARHTHTGSISVSVLSVNGRVRVEVTDTGEGIPTADLPYIFERFYRADSARAQDTGGAGIGLAIARRIVEDHAGTVFASSVEGRGATVGFELPADRT